jgi:putative CocE/NonD family hydrolase
MGPWDHGGWNRDGDRLGPVSFGSKTSEFFRDEILLPFFNHFLKGKGELKLPEAYVFETGTNQWRKYDAWPPRTAHEQALYLREGGRLAFEPPANEVEACDEYLSDPGKPVPFIGSIEIGMAYEYMVADQRFASSRPDVLVYLTEPLERDLTAAGPLTATLYVSTSGTDSDWIVKLIDVYPDDYPDPDPNPANVRMGGYQQLVRGEPFRGKFRNSFEKPEPFEPGQVTRVEFTLPDVYHVFRRGHRVMVHIQSSWFPLVDRNPQKFMRIHQARESDFQKATQRVCRSRSRPSLVKIRVL